MTGRFPVRNLADAKMCSRLGVRRAVMHPLESSESVIKLKTRYRERGNGDLLNGHRPAAIDEARNKSGTKAVVDIHDSYV